MERRGPGVPPGHRRGCQGQLRSAVRAAAGAGAAPAPARELLTCPCSAFRLPRSSAPHAAHPSALRPRIAQNPSDRALYRPQVDNQAAKRSSDTESDWQTLHNGPELSFAAPLRPGRHYVVRVVAKLVEQGAAGTPIRTATSDGYLFRTVPMAPEDMQPPLQSGGARNILKVSGPGLHVLGPPSCCDCGRGPCRQLLAAAAMTRAWAASQSSAAPAAAPATAAGSIHVESQLRAAWRWRCRLSSQALTPACADSCCCRRCSSSGAPRMRRAARTTSATRWS
jgi:hypothetical protein